MLTLKTNALKYKNSEGNMQDISAIIGEKGVDPTLTQSKQAADAAVVGEKFEQLNKDITDEVTARKEADSILKARIDAFTALEEGSTTGDAELIDARVDCEGKEWSNVGTHIRGITGKIIEAGFDKTIVAGDVINFLKPSEFIYMHRLQDDSAELVSSNNQNLVTNFIPVEYGKYYTFSRELDGVRVLYGASTVGRIGGRMNIQKTDGSIIYGQQGTLTVGAYTESTIYINSEDIAAIQLQINLGTTIDISTPELFKNQKVMMTSADSYEESLQKALNSEYVDGENGIQNDIIYSMKHDDTKADKTAMEEITENVSEINKSVEEIIEACCDKKVVSDNYNLYKISEAAFKSRLQDDSYELVSSTVNNVVSGWIPVKYGKFYTCSVEIDGVRDTVSNSTNSVMGRVNVKLTDGTILTNQRMILMYLSHSKSTIGISIENAVAIQFQTNMPNIDISTADKLKETKIMLVEGDTAEQAYENSLNLEYIDGDVVIAGEIEYSLKHDNTKADKIIVDELCDDVSALKQNAANNTPIKASQKYDANYILNERFIRGIANLRDPQKSKEFQIAINNNSGNIIKNAAIVVGLHNTVGIIPENNNLPFQIYDEIFSDQVGFKFFDGDIELPYYIESESDCNYIVDKNVKTDQKTMAVFSDGKIAVYNETNARMQISSDDGLTWTNICENITSIPYRILLPDSQDNLFVASNDGKKLYKYTSLDGYITGTEVIDMSDTDTQIGSILAEDSDGNLYLGTYQTIFHCVIRKSTDHGNTWTIVFDSTNCQHVHNIFINKKVTPNEIFIGLDNASGDLTETYVSTDAGETWTKVDVPYGNRDYAFRYAGENFYIGCGERLYLGGSTLYKTSDYTDTGAYYPLFDNGQGIRDITNVLENSDDVLIAGGCVDASVNTEQLFLSEDRGETWKTVFIRPYHQKQRAAGAGLRTFSKKENQILSQTSTDYAMRFVYGNGAKTILAVVNIGDVPTDGKTITMKTGHVANIEQMDTVLTSYEEIVGKVADIQICDGYVIDKVSNKRVMTDQTELVNSRIKIGQTSEHKILSNHAYRLTGSVNLGKLSRLTFTKGFTISFLFRKEDGKNYLSDDKYHIIFQSGNTKFVLWYRSLVLMSGETNIYAKRLYISDAHLASVNEDYIRITAYFTNDELPIAKIHTENYAANDGVTCTEYPITENFSENDFIVGNSLSSSAYAEIPNITRIEIYNRVLSHGEIMSLTNGCNLITDGSEFN